MNYPRHKRKPVRVPKQAVYQMGVTAIDPRTKQSISFDHIKAACTYLGIKKNSYFLEVIYQGKIFHGYRWMWTRQLPQFLDWEYERYAPWIPAYLARTKVEKFYREASISGVQFRTAPPSCFTL